MKKSILTSSAIVLLAFLILHSCRKREDEICMDPTNPKCANYDPCHGVEPPSAMFIMQEDLLTNNGWDWTPDDTVFFGGNIRFSSPYTDEKYKHTWYLGIEVIHDPSFERDHSSVPLAQRPTSITVSHVLEYPIDVECFPNATGRDSVSRTYYLIRYWNEFLSVGKFRGAFEGQVDSFDFQTVVINSDGTIADIENSFGVQTYLINFHNNQDTNTYFAWRPRNSWIHFPGSGSGTGRPKGDMFIDPKTHRFNLQYNLHGNDYKVKGRVIE